MSPAIADQADVTVATRVIRRTVAAVRQLRWCVFDSRDANRRGAEANQTHQANRKFGEPTLTRRFRMMPSGRALGSEHRAEEES